MSRLLSPTALAGAVLVASIALISPAGAATSQHRTTANVIKISNFGFHGDFTVKTGATVKVKNKDGVTHTLTSNTNLFDTGHIHPGTSHTFKAPTTPGRYKFHCKIHTEMKGTLVVKRHP